jgi:lysozyme family protein
MHAIKGGASWKEFGGGWQKRVDDLKSYCLHIITGTHAIAPVAVDLSHVETPKATATGDTAGMGTASISFGAGTAVYAAGFPWYIVGGVVLATIALGIIYEAVSANKASTTNATVLLPVVPLPPLSRPPAVA